MKSRVFFIFYFIFQCLILVGSGNQARQRPSFAGVPWKLPCDFRLWRDRLKEDRSRAVINKNNKNKQGFDLIKDKLENNLNLLKTCNEEQLNIAYKGELEAAISSFTIVYDRCCEISVIFDKA